LVLIDEIGTIFNSRDFAASKESVPKILFQHLCQVRKRHLMIIATSQRWNFVDKQLRDIVATVRVCHVHLSHPFSRLGTVHVYDSHDYDLAFSNPMCPLIPLSAYAYERITSSDRTFRLTGDIIKYAIFSPEDVVRQQSLTDAAPINFLVLLLLLFFNLSNRLIKMYLLCYFQK